MDRQLDDDGYDVTDEDGGRASSRLPVVVVGVASAVVLTVSAGLVAFTMSGSDTTEHTARAAEATVVTALGNTVSGGAAAIDAAVPYTTAALDGSMAEPLGLAAGGDTVPPRVLEAYRAAESTLEAESPTCRLPWWLLAGIGKVQSDHAAGGQVDANGTASVRIVGPRLDGTVVGGSMVRDTDQGRLDGDTTFDRGVGPMLLLPQTWEHIGRDGGADGPADVANADDAALAVGTLLCSADADLTTPDGLARGLVMFDDSARFPADVLPWAAYYRAQLGDTGGSSPTPTTADSATGGATTTPAPTAATGADPGQTPPAADEEQTEGSAAVGPGFTTQPATEPPSADPPAVTPRPASTPNTPAATPGGTTGTAPAAPATPAPQRTSERTTAPSTTPARTPEGSSPTSAAPRPTTNDPAPTSTPRRTTSSPTSTPTSGSTPTRDRPRSTPTSEQQRSTPTSTPTTTRERRRSTPTSTPTATSTTTRERQRSTPTPTATQSERRERRGERERQRERQSDRERNDDADDGDDDGRAQGDDRDDSDDD